MKYRKKPVVIEAVQYMGDHEILWATFPNDEIKKLQYAIGRIDGLESYILIPTLEGEMKASIGDYIIRGVNGEYYPCKPDIFEKTYDAADNGGDPPPSAKKIPEIEYTYSALRLPKFKPGTTKDPLDSAILSCLVIVKKPDNYYIFDVQGWDPSESHDKETEAEMDERWCDRNPKDRIVAWFPLGNSSNVQMHKILNRACARS